MEEHALSVRTACVCECVLLMEAMASVSVCVFLVGMCVF